FGERHHPFPVRGERIPRLVYDAAMTSSFAPGASGGETIEALATPEEEAPRPAVSLEDILPTSVAAPAPAVPAATTAPGRRTARVAGVAGRRATIAFRGRGGATEVTIAPEVDPGVVADAVESGELVLVEVAEGEAPLVVGVLHTRRPRELKLRAAVVQVEGDEEVLIRSGRGAIRIRADGDIEVVGSRSSAASRGVVKIVG